MDNRYGDDYNGSYIPRGPPSYSESNTGQVNSYSGSIPRVPPSYSGSIPRSFDHNEKDFDENKRISEPPPSYNFTIPSSYDSASYSSYMPRPYYPPQNIFENYGTYNYFNYYNMPLFNYTSLANTSRGNMFHLSICVMCAASVPKHFPSKCPALHTVSNTWPSICYKCKPYLPQHEPELCPNVTSLSYKDKAMAPKMPNHQTVITNSKLSRMRHLNSRIKGFTAASDDSVQGTTFLPEKTKKTFVQRLPPISSFLRPKSGHEECNNINCHDTYVHIPQSVSQTPPYKDNTDRVIVERLGSPDYTLLPDSGKKNVSYTRPLQIVLDNEVEKPRKGCRQKVKKITVGVNNKTGTKVRGKTVKIANQHRSSFPLNHKQNQNSKCNTMVYNGLNCTRDHSHSDKGCTTLWNDLSFIGLQESDDKENKAPDCMLAEVPTNTGTVVMGSDSEVDLYTSNDEEDVLTNTRQELTLKSANPGRDMTLCLAPLIEHPEMLSQKTLSLISPIDEISGLLNDSSKTASGISSQIATTYSTLPETNRFKKENNHHHCKEYNFLT